MHHLDAVADVFEPSCGGLKLLLDNGQAGSCIHGQTLDEMVFWSAGLFLSEIAIGAVADGWLYVSLVSVKKTARLCGF